LRHRSKGGIDRMNAPGRILVVDGDASDREVLADLVRREGFDAVVATSGAEALSVIAQEPIDLVLLDLPKGGSDGGIAMLNDLQTRGLVPDLPVVVMTAHEDRKSRIDALRAGATEFLAKPVDRVEVACRLRTLLELEGLRDGAMQGFSEAEHLLRRSDEQSPVAKITWDTQGRVMEWNNAAKRLFGFTRQEAMGRHGDFIAAGDVWVSPAPTSSWDSAEAQEPHPPHTCTRHNITKDGRTITCEWYSAPLTLLDGELLGLCTVILDVTEQVRLQEALTLSSKMEAFGQLAGGVAHDFNNILGVIVSYATFARDSLRGNSEARSDIEQVLRAADRAAGLTKQLLTVARQRPTEMRPTDLNERLEQLADLLGRTLGDQVELVAVTAERATVVEIDPVQFDQIVLNLAVNARDAMPQGGRLELRLSHAQCSPSAGTDEECVRLVVRDTGVGIDAATRARIFEPFFTTKGRGKGTGLGLATCFGIVVGVGGTIGVESEPGQGTTFVVQLPASTKSVVPEPQTERMFTGDAKGAQVLVVEDEPTLRSATVRALERAGFGVHAVAGGTEALTQLEELGPRLSAIVTDVSLPGCSGLDVARRAAVVAPHAAIVLTSGYLDEAASADWSAELPILWKPVGPDELAQAVGRAVEAKRPRKDTAPSTRGDGALVVEDDADVRELLVRLASAAGYDTTVAGTVAEGRRVLEAGADPRVVLCDLSLPDGSGAELLQWIEHHRPELVSRVVILSGGAVDERGRSVMEGGTFRTLSKPFDAGQLLDLLEDLAVSA
jgi:PAS domain S-box-containing protein